MNPMLSQSTKKKGGLDLGSCPVCITRLYPLKSPMTAVQNQQVRIGKALKITAKAPENRPGPKRKGSSSNYPFSGAFAVSFREGISCVSEDDFPGFRLATGMPCLLLV